MHPSCSYFSFKTESWKNSTDCCEWDGVTCDTVSGYVIGLDLRCNNLKGELHPNSTIFQLRHLQQLNLAFNDFSWSPMHVGIGGLVNLTHLNLSNSHLSSDIPSTISHLSKLVSLDLGGNDWMELNPFTWKKLIHNATKLSELYLDGVVMSAIRGSSLSMLKNLSSFLVSLSLASTSTELHGQLSSEIPYSIGKLKSLTHLDLSLCNFDGIVPLSLWNLTQLTYLDLSLNKLNGGEIPNVYGNLIKLEYLSLSYSNLTGQVPSSFFHLPQLSYLDLSYNKLVGPIPNEIAKHSKLSYADLGYNMLNGTIPQWCYYLPSLLALRLSNNHLTGFIGEFLTYSLLYLGLSNNNFHGNFPNSIFEFQNLLELDLSSTNLSGVVDFHQFSKFKTLCFLNLSHNSYLSINIDSKAESISSLYLQELDLSFSNSNGFPKFPVQTNLGRLDLSHNNIHGKIPKWFHNLLNSLEHFEYIDLSFNKLQGELPIPPLNSLLFKYFLLSNNNFTGDISSSFCNASHMEVLNLAHNKLTGMIPQCLGTLRHLSVLDLQMNNLYGSMPRNFTKDNHFETIKLNGNQLEGPLPHSLAHCKILEVLDLGDNSIGDTFPNWLETLPELQVLSLRSNKLYGTITCSSTKHPFPKLRIVDVSNNNFSGPLPTSCIKKFQGMMKVNDSQIGSQYMDTPYYYEDSVVVIMKGFSMELARILTTFTTIDLSNNMFEGEIPQLIGDLKFLKGLNLSNNGITGTIPPSLSYLRNLEWLDLSRNQLRGEIPTALTKLNFLSVLNLSQNHLEGMIPKGQQFDTFGNDSYDGNTMLCGLPLSKSCKNDEDRPPHSTYEDEEESRFGWEVIAIGYVCGAISGLVLGHNVFFFGKPECLARLVEQMFDRRLKRTNNRAGANRRRMN
ncbi:receptor protein [Trifolium repens]|nr:receptor protein [Trifolium repens]